MRENLAEQHQELGRVVVQWIAEYVRGLDDCRVCTDATPGELEKLFDEDLPQLGQSAEEILRQFTERVAPQAMNIASPRYYGLFNPTPLPIAVWADALCSALNQNEAAWRNSPSASMVEAQVIRWLCELVGYNGAAFGTLTSGGSEANLVGLKCARDRAGAGVRQHGVRAAIGDLTVYTSELGHYSLDKSVDILGLGRKHLRLIRTDESFHLDAPALVAQIERDVREGYTPCCIAAAAGATSNGVIDGLEELAHIARRYDLWLHVDAAYGGALAFSPKYRGLLRGLELADSITVDPHKWMFVPFACGACWCAAAPKFYAIPLM
ncbi:MAG: pyridoxal-dependent decarboxylase [Pyrinomonadaceae bacterium]